MLTQNNFDQFSAFVKLYQHAKNQSILSIGSWEIVEYFGPTFANLYQYAKYQFITSVHSEDKANFWFPWQNWQHLFFTTLFQKDFDWLSVFVNLYQHAKSQTTSSICSGEIVDLKILHSDWLRGFWTISQKQDFSQIWTFYRNTENNTYFHYRTNPVKINDQIFQ